MKKSFHRFGRQSRGTIFSYLANVHYTNFQFNVRNDAGSSATKSYAVAQAYRICKYIAYIVIYSW